MSGHGREAHHVGELVTERCANCRGLFELVTMSQYRGGMWCLRCALDALHEERNGTPRGTTGRLSPRYRPIRRMDYVEDTE